MTAVEILAELHRRGGHVEPLPDGRLLVRPSGILDDALRKALRAQRLTLAAVLAAPKLRAPATCGSSCGGGVAWQGADGAYWCSHCTRAPDARTVRWWYATDDDLKGDLLAPDALRALDALRPDEQRDAVAALRAANETRDDAQRRRHIEYVVAWLGEGRRRLEVNRS